MRIIGQLPGAIVYAGRAVYRWEDTTEVRQGKKDCDYFWESPHDPGPDNHQDFEVKGARMTRLDAADSVDLTGFPDVENADLFNNTVTLAASMGPYLFIQSSYDGYFCGAAHPISGHDDRVFDLSRKDYVRFPTQQDETALRKRALEVDRQAIERCVAEVRSSMTPAGPDSIQSFGLDRALPRFFPGRGVKFVLTFSFIRSYVDGERSCEATVDAVPPMFAMHGPPAGLSELIGQRPGFEIGGYSSLGPQEQDLASVVAKVFEAVRDE